MAFDQFCNSGKCALITGAAGLLGFEHAMALLKLIPPLSSQTQIMTL